MRKLVALLSFFVFTSNAVGSVKDYVDKFVVTTPADTAGVYESQQRKYYVGGRLTMSSPKTVVTPFYVDPPSVNAGCNGIDISFGSFSYLSDLKYWKKFAESVFNPSTVASFAFDIAMGALCEKCSSTLKKLTSLANQINAMSLDSCKMNNFISDSLRDYVAGTDVAKSLNGMTSNWLDGADRLLDNVTDFVADFNADINCAGFACKFGNKLENTDSYLEELFKDTDMYDDDMVKILRYYIGDFKINLDKKPAIVSIENSGVGVLSDSEVRKLVEIISGYTDSGCGTTNATGVDKNGNTVTISNYYPVCKEAETAINDIYDAIRFRYKPSATSINFLRKFEVPAYSVLNMISLSPDSFKESIKEKLIRLFSYQYAHQVLSYAIRAIDRKSGEVIANINPDLKEKDYGKSLFEHLDMMKKNAVNVLEEVDKEYKKAYMDFRKAMEDQKFYAEIQEKIMASMSHSPIVNAYLMSLGISKI